MGETLIWLQFYIHAMRETVVKNMGSRTAGLKLRVYRDILLASVNSSMK